MAEQHDYVLLSRQRAAELVTYWGTDAIMNKRAGVQYISGDPGESPRLFGGQVKIDRSGHSSFELNNLF